MKLENFDTFIFVLFAILLLPSIELEKRVKQLISLQHNTFFATRFFNFYKWENIDFTTVENDQSLQTSSEV